MSPNVINIRHAKLTKNQRAWTKKVLIFKINLCDKIFSYSSAYALMCWNLYLKHWAALLYLLLARGGARTKKRRKKRASVFLLSLPPQYFTPHTHCEGIIPPHWYLSISAGIIFSPVASCWMDASLYCIFALRARCWYYLIWIPIANICLAIVDNGQEQRWWFLLTARRNREPTARCSSMALKNNNARSMLCQNKGGNVPLFICLSLRQLCQGTNFLQSLTLCSQPFLKL